MNQLKRFELMCRAMELPEHSETYSSAVGFDLVKCRVYIRSVDWNIFHAVASKASGVINYKSDSLEDHLKYTLSGGNNAPLDIEGNCKYATIVIDYRYFSLRLLSSNIKGKADIYQLTIHVVPQNEHLENLNNFNCQELKQRVREVMTIMRKYGIHLDDERVTINYFELNRNYCCDINSSYFISYFDAAFASLPDRFNVFPKYNPWGKFGAEDINGIFANSTTIQLHMYDKTIDIEGGVEKKNKKREKKEYLYIFTDIIRVEFVVIKAKQVESWLSTANVFELEQKQIEAAYYRNIDKYVLTPFANQYKVFYSMMAMPFETSNKRWTDEFIRDMLINSKKCHLDPVFIKIEDIKKILVEYPESSTIRQNLGRCEKLIRKKAGNVLSGDDYAEIMKYILLSPEKKYTVIYCHTIMTNLEYC